MLQITSQTYPHPSTPLHINGAPINRAEESYSILVIEPDSEVEDEDEVHTEKSSSGVGSSRVEEDRADRGEGGQAQEDGPRRVMKKDWSRFFTFTSPSIPIHPSLSTNSTITNENNNSNSIKGAESIPNPISNLIPVSLTSTSTSTSTSTPTFTPTFKYVRTKPRQVRQMGIIPVPTPPYTSLEDPGIKGEKSITDGWAWTSKPCGSSSSTSTSPSRSGAVTPTASREIPRPYLHPSSSTSSALYPMTPPDSPPFPTTAFSLLTTSNKVPASTRDTNPHSLPPPLVAGPPTPRPLHQPAHHLHSFHLNRIARSDTSTSAEAIAGGRREPRLRAWENVGQEMTLPRRRVTVVAGGFAAVKSMGNGNGEGNGRRIGKGKGDDEGQMGGTRPSAALASAVRSGTVTGLRTGMEETTMMDVDEKEVVSKEEMAAWRAGKGDGSDDHLHCLRIPASVRSREKAKNDGWTEVDEMNVVTGAGKVEQSRTGRSRMKGGVGAGVGMMELGIVAMMVLIWVFCTLSQENFSRFDGRASIFGNGIVA